MAGDDQERFEDYLELERYIEDLQAGRVTRPPDGLTPELARVYRMATIFHSASIDDATPRPEFVAGLQAKLESEEAKSSILEKKSSPFSSKKPQTEPRVSRRALLRRGAATAVAAASVAVAVGIDHTIEEQRIASLTATKKAASWSENIVPASIASNWLFVTTLDSLGDHPARFTSDAIVGYVIRNDDSDSDAGKSRVVAMSAACTHMGCIVQWQDADRKYHCPCHGGVFTEYGQTDNTHSAVPYLASLPRLETRVDPDGSIYVRVPAATNV